MLGQKSWKKIRWFLEDLKTQTPKGHFEINWPLKELAKRLLQGLLELLLSLMPLSNVLIRKGWHRTFWSKNLFRNNILHGRKWLSRVRYADRLTKVAWRKLEIHTRYSIVKDSNADLGVIFRFLQNSPITKAVCTKISKKCFLHFWQYFDISEKK